MKIVLMVAEKPSLAQSIAKILSRGNMSSRKGLNGACSVHEFTGLFIGQTVHFKMTSVCGHVMTLDFIGKYNNWDKVDPAELFSKAPTEKKEANPKLNMVKFLQVEGRGCDYVVLWLDCDKEGENICFEVLDAILPVMNKPRGGEKTTYRAKFSSITDTDICNAMNQLGEPNHNEALSVDARQELDLRIGCAFTRFQTKYFQGKYGNLDSSLISFGPCQTPTLGFCVERHDKIQSFKPETYWVLQAKVIPEKDSCLTLEWDRVRIFDREIAQMFLNLTKMAKEAKVESVSKKEKVKQRPLALNTVEMLRVASAALGMGPQHTMQIAERLYTQGYISYPRTETTHYPENFDLKGPLRQQANNPYWAETVKTLLVEGVNRPRKGHDAGDHPPITPMRAASEAELGGDGWRLYEYITRHFIATISADCKYLQTTIACSVASERFTCIGKMVLSPGFTEVMPWQSIPLEESLPSCERGDLYPVSEVKLLEKQTCPPDYLTEAELITLMEKHGIGTDASIPVHINNICQRNYVTVEGGRRLKPTNLGIVLVHGYYKIDAELVLPTIRSAVEKQLNLIAQGKANFHQVLEHTLDIFKRKFHYFVDSIAGRSPLLPWLAF
uniref:DNA topoisomerase n=1 Tax=Micrurus corallinus TaxID=54390 RepID=A0A2D4GH70_MICCO